MNDRPTPTAKDVSDPEVPLSPILGPSKPRFLSVLGPGLITGASDDDPSGIATYSQAGAQFGYALGWTLLFTYPLMVAVQMIAARIGRTTGRGLAGNLRQHFPAWLLHVTVLLVVAANGINVGANLGAMADALRLLVGGPQLVYVLAFAMGCVLMQVFLQYTRYVSILKWLTLALLAYLGTLFVARVSWGEALGRLLLPSIDWSPAYLATIVALLGTTISPYLFFWQASQEAEDVRTMPHRHVLKRAPEQGDAALQRIELDTIVGMGASNLVALAIVWTSAATFHAKGIQDIDSSAEAAEALRPIAGPLAEALFALGIIGTGLLAVPVLAGSAAYAIGEALRWPVGLARKPLEAKAFYGTVAAATALGMAVNFSAIEPIRALFWSAVINGIVVVPVMVVMMLMASRRKVMGEFAVTGWLRGIGWTATALMALAVIALALTS